jgi:hypothetical protein
MPDGDEIKEKNKSGPLNEPVTIDLVESKEREREINKLMKKNQRGVKKV